MKKPFFISLFLSVFLSIPAVYAQAETDSTLEAQTQARIWAEVRKPYFKATANDSLFVVNNSEFPFRYDAYTRSEIAGFMEQLFFNGSVGDVVGPLYLEGYAILYKITGFDSTYRLKASHIFLKPDGTTRKDTANTLKKANKILKEIKKGTAFAEAAKKYGQDETAKTGGDIGWFGEGMMVREFETAVMNGKKGDLLVTQTPFGAHVISITDDKQKEARGKIIVIPLMKKI